jgi:transposase
MMPLVFLSTWLEIDDLLDSIPGIGQTTAALLLAEIVNIKQYKSARQVAAYAGLVPRERRSGSSVRGRSAVVKNRKRSASQSTLLSGNDSFAMQQFLSAMGERNA